MIEPLAQALQTALAVDGLYLLILAVFVAGLVRGFSGFGTAMIYMPFAGTVLPPVWALTTMVVFDLFGPLPLVPRALKDGHPKDILRLGLGALIAVPAGLFVLSRLSPDLFRWAVAGITLLLLLLLISGWRYRGVLSRRMTYVIGALGGFLAGSSGVAGPPVIMLYMSSLHPVRVIRANILLFLLLTDILTMLVMAASGLLHLVPLMIGGLLVLPYLIANMIGGALFRPDYDRLYRLLAYGLIAVSAVSNLPLWG